MSHDMTSVSSLNLCEPRLRAKEMTTMAEDGRCNSHIDSQDLKWIFNLTTHVQHTYIEVRISERDYNDDGYMNKLFTQIVRWEQQTPKKALILLWDGLQTHKKKAQLCLARYINLTGQDSSGWDTTKILSRQHSLSGPKMQDEMTSNTEILIQTNYSDNISLSPKKKRECQRRDSMCLREWTAEISRLKWEGEKQSQSKHYISIELNIFDVWKFRIRAQNVFDFLCCTNNIDSAESYLPFPPVPKANTILIYEIDFLENFSSTTCRSQPHATPIRWVDDDEETF